MTDLPLATRILRFPLTRALLATLFTLGAYALVSGLLGLVEVSLLVTEGEPIGWKVAPWLAGLWRLLRTVLSVTAALFGYRAYVRLVERRPPAELSPAGAAAEVALGGALGAGLITVVVLALWLADAYRVTGVVGLGALALPLAAALEAGVLEEIVFRGVVFRIVEESLGSFLSLAFSALLFGFAHVWNPGATLLSSLAIALEAGVLLTAVYLLTRRLWGAIGLHAAWNFTEGGVFGAPVSGKETAGFLEAELSGPGWLSGGVFGPEASLVAVVLVTFVGALLLLHAYRSGRVVAPAWRRGSEREAGVS